MFLLPTHGTVRNVPTLGLVQYAVLDDMLQAFEDSLERVQSDCLEIRDLWECTTGQVRFQLVTTLMVMRI